jgi:hypothetical protein
MHKKYSGGFLPEYGDVAALGRVSTARIDESIVVYAFKQTGRHEHMHTKSDVKSIG